MKRSIVGKLAVNTSVRREICMGFGCMEKEKLSMQHVEDDWIKLTNSLR